MTQRSLFWNGAILGDCGPYTQAEIHDRFFRALLNGTGDRGPLKGWLNELEVSGSSPPVSVASGGAVVYGMLFESDAAVAVSVPTPSAGNSRYDRVVVRRDWTAQTVRVARVAGVAAPAPAVPALTQVAGAMWEIPLATLLVTEVGTITVTDTRDFAAFTTEWPADVVTTAMYLQGAVTAAKIPNRTRHKLKGSGQIRPNSANPPTWTAGASYDYWSFADGAFNRAWAYFMAPTGMVGASVAFYAWSVPHVNGAGGGVENCQWDYSVYSGDGIGATLTNTAASVNVDQQLRVNTTVYRDQLIAALAVSAGQIIAFRLSRDGAADSYNSAMRLLGIEMEWTADA